MALFNNKRLPPIGEALQFQQFIASLWELRYPHVSVMCLGRNGQKQWGIDILAQGAHLTAIQCKAGETFTRPMLVKAVEKAATYHLPFQELVIVTAAPHDARLVNAAAAISGDHVARGTFRVSIYGWEEVLRWLTPYPALMRTYFAEFMMVVDAPPVEMLLKLEDDGSIGMKDFDLAPFCSEGAAMLAGDERAIIRVELPEERRLKEELARLSSDRSTAMRVHSSNLRAELDRLEPRRRQLESAIRLLLTDDAARSPWLPAGDWGGFAITLRATVREVLRPALSGRPDALALKIRAPGRSSIVTWLDLDGTDRNDFLRRNKHYRPDYFLGDVADLGGGIGSRYALPAGIAALARFSSRNGVPVENLRRQGATSIHDWRLEAA